MSAPRSTPKTNLGRAYVASGSSYRQPPARTVEIYDIEYKKGGAEHAWRRHTRQGIHKAGQVETDHATSVAVFDSEAALDEALESAPTRSDEWQSGKGGRYDAFVGGVGYQAVLLGNTMSLFTCFPTRGKEYDKNYLKTMLAKHGMKKFDAFWLLVDELDPLDERLRRIWAPRKGATAEEEAAHRDRAVATGAAIDKGDKSGAEQLLAELETKDRELGQVIAAREAEAVAERLKQQAAEEAERKKRDAPLVAMRAALNELADAPFKEEDRARAHEIVAALTAANFVVNPSSMSKVKSLYDIT